MGVCLGERERYSRTERRERYWLRIRERERERENARIREREYVHVGVRDRGKQSGRENV